jgi:hypothetical protein
MWWDLKTFVNDEASNYAEKGKFLEWMWSGGLQNKESLIDGLRAIWCLI